MTIDYGKTLYSLGIIAERRTQKEYNAECPFCGKANLHFQMNRSNGKWGCFSCDRKGNLLTFLRQYYQECQLYTTKKDYAKLSEQRGLPSSVFEAAGIVKSKVSSEYLIPIHNTSDKITTLWKYDGKKIQYLANPGDDSLRRGFYSIGEIQEGGNIYICEGVWDALTMYFLTHGDENYTGAYVGLPGAAEILFYQSWADLFDGCIVHLCFDNDEAGKKGLNNAAYQLQNKARTLYHVEWTNKDPVGYDVNDFYNDKKDPEKRSDISGVRDKLLSKFIILQEIQDNVTFAEEPAKFKDVIKTYDKFYDLSQDLKDGIAIVGAATYSTKVEGVPIWLFLIAQPGAMKTTILDSYLNTTLVYTTSEVTDVSLQSGFDPKDGHDPSLLPKLKHRSLHLTDFTQTLNKTGRHTTKNIWITTWWV